MSKANANFVAIDFETANHDRNSACEVGLVKVSGGNIVAEHSILIRPPANKFVPRFIELHGISWKEVRHAPTFPSVWETIQPVFEGAEFVAAHNESFDRNVLKATCDHYQLASPTIPFLCSMRLSRDLWSIRPTGLPNVCKVLDIPFGRHHKAIEDARACANIVIRAYSERFRFRSSTSSNQAKQLGGNSTSKKTTSQPNELSMYERRKALGNWGEKIVPGLLEKAGFERIRNLNDKVSHHPYADFLAQREKEWFLISVKTRNKLTAQGRLNSSYNLRKKGKDLMPLVKEYGAELAWVAIQTDVENQRYSAFFGTVDEIEDKGERFSIPMSETNTERYEALALNQLDHSIALEWSNQKQIAGSSKGLRISRKAISFCNDPASEILGFRPGTKTHHAITL